MFTLVAAGVVVLGFLLGIRIVPQTHRGVVETLGKYSRSAVPGFHWVIPVIQRVKTVNVTETMADIEPQEIITEDNLNAKVDLVIYFQVKKDDESVFKAFYEVNDIESQIVVLAQTTARNVIGGMVFKDVNSQRKTLNTTLAEILRAETDKWGVEVVRVELKDIVPPRDVQDAMNQVIMAENRKRAAIDFATAAETEADGRRRAAIKSAEGEKQSAILVAEGTRESLVLEADGQAKAFKLINESFTGNAQVLRKLEVTEKSLKDNAKVIITKDGINPNLILGDLK